MAREEGQRDRGTDVSDENRVPGRRLRCRSPDETSDTRTPTGGDRQTDRAYLWWTGGWGRRGMWEVNWLQNLKTDGETEKKIKRWLHRTCVKKTTCKHY